MLHNFFPFDRLVYGIFTIFTLLHIFANFRAVSCVVMETFNRSRYSLLVKHFLEEAGDIASVEKVNKQESVWLRCGRHFVNVNLGSPLSSVAATHDDLCSRAPKEKQARYLLKVVRDSSRHYDINVVLHEQCTPRDQMEAMFHSFLLEFVLLKTLKVDTAHPWRAEVRTIENAAENLAADESQLFTASRAFVGKYFPVFWKGLECSEWRTDHVLFATSDWRVVWDAEERKEASPGDSVPESVAL